MTLMPEALFYHLERKSLEDVLPGLLERTRERDWRAVVRVGSAERMAALDTHLWTYSEQTFLAHGTAAEGHSSRQPIYLTLEDENPNHAQVLFLVGGAQPSDWAGARLKDYARIVLLFDGRDGDALASARAAWRSAKDAGHDVTYWKESASGKWEKQA
jgi:DNA polymerase-3 subunit chi